MCGIAGTISCNKDVNFCNTFTLKMLELTKHRGPDQGGVFSDKISSCRFCLGANRLSIIDVSPLGDQPMHLDDLTMVYNGEVYNYLEIRQELANKGHRFIGHSDTEVVLHAFKEWGLDCVSRFIGMFAIAIFDRADNKLYLIRDRVGEKPLYYYVDKDILFFSSEIKGILAHDCVDKELSQNGVFNYLIFNSVSSPYTIFGNINQVLPGQIVSVSVDQGKIILKEKQYWSFPDLMPDYSLTEGRVISDIEKLIHDAVKIRLRSDVPLGIFLSGGIDSTLIASVASGISSHVKTFTIGYKDKIHDESPYAEFVARHIKTDHETILLDKDKANLNFSELAYMSDDCLANIALIPYYTLAKITRQKVKVVLSGDGGDEFFCGYSKSYGRIAKLFKYRKIAKLFARLLVFNKKAAAVNNILSATNDLSEIVSQYAIREQINNIKSVFNSQKEKLSIYKRIDIKDKMPLAKNRSLFWFLNYYDGGGNYLTDTVLKTTDRVSMFNSLEARTVFTDYRIIEYMACVPDTIILKNGIDKYILKKILSRYLPKKFVFSRTKKGFSVPLTSDYKEQWENAISAAEGLLTKIKNSSFDLSRIKYILRKDQYNLQLQYNLAFLAFFMKKWRLV